MMLKFGTLRNLQKNSEYEDDKWVADSSDIQKKRTG